jgi:SAM-dependent methyltransferase
MKLYDNPRYYDIAFAWRDIAHEVDVLETLSVAHGRGSPGHVLEVACGHAPHAREWMRRGWQYTGIDLNARMLDEARQCDCGEGLRLIEADLRRFDLPGRQQADLATTLLGSLYVESERELQQHLDCIARALAPGGLYVLDWCIEFGPIQDQTWEEERDGVRVQINFRSVPVPERGERVVREILSAKVNDHGREFELRDEALRLMLMPEDLHRLLADRDDFECIGCWNNWNLHEPIETASKIARPIVALRHRQSSGVQAFASSA